jgi:hypothetical protein
MGGVDAHKLFELNVRGELRRNPVSRQLDAVIRREHDHSDFLASHNGMTVTCDRFDDSDTKHVVVHRPSIVNGAHSTMAFLRADGDGLLTDELRVFVKLVEVEGRPTFANSVSACSNTQNAVNPRNLVANTGPQRRLLKDFAEGFPGIYYETKPDAHKTVELKRHNARVIGNDDAAQLLFTVYVQQPWLAVKRNSLFEADQYPQDLRRSRPRRTRGPSRRACDDRQRGQGTRGRSVTERAGSSRKSFSSTCSTKFSARTRN